MVSKTTSNNYRIETNTDGQAKACFNDVVTTAIDDDGSIIGKKVETVSVLIGDIRAAISNMADGPPPSPPIMIIPVS